MNTDLFGTPLPDPSNLPQDKSTPADTWYEPLKNFMNTIKGAIQIQGQNQTVQKIPVPGTNENAYKSTDENAAFKAFLENLQQEQKQKNANVIQAQGGR